MATKINPSPQKFYRIKDVGEDVEITLPDIFNFIKRCSPKELTAINEKLALPDPYYRPETIMEEIAMQKLKEVLRFKGPEWIMNIINNAK